MAGTNDASAGWLWVQVADEQPGLFKYPVMPGGWREVKESSDIVRTFEIGYCLVSRKLPFPFPFLSCSSGGRLVHRRAATVLAGPVD